MGSLVPPTTRSARSNFVSDGNLFAATEVGVRGAATQPTSALTSPMVMTRLWHPVGAAQECKRERGLASRRRYPCVNCRSPSTHRGRSTVRKQSNSVAARCSNWPFLIPDHPISATVRTAWPVNSARRRFGTHSSSNTRMSECQVSGLLNCCYGKLARHAWEILKKLI